jgi:hypothetical protein
MTLSSSGRWTILGQNDARTHKQKYANQRQQLLAVGAQQSKKAGRLIR